ncbi:formyltransferase family protein [Bosea sp. AS-1]|uniref:formyltransferase family protein n=1 Tax=Bosea sp. AS-1 TaxID=2015316 RepID=UPI000B77F0A8|nr:formyltransferase family protein [Bosea sp. AS-1]
MNGRIELVPAPSLDASEMMKVRERLTDPSAIVAGHDPDRVVLLADPSDDLAASMVQRFGRPLFVRSVEDLRLASGRVLLSYGTSVIVPADVLERFAGRAYNIHAASPDYPGRDPHHWATYDGVTRYGATMHVMTERVDEGAIVDVEWFDVPTGAKPSQLLAMANDAALRIMKRNAAKLRAGAALMPLPGVKWGGVKRSRKDFLEICRITPDIEPAELDRRFNAFDGERHANLWVEICGRRFVVDRR